MQHDDVGPTGEPSRETTHELRVELDGEDVRRTLGERLGEDAATGAELDHPIVAVDAGVGDELRRQPGVTEKVLTEVPVTAPAAGCVPGHGRPRPCESLPRCLELQQTQSGGAVDFRGVGQPPLVSRRISSSLSSSPAAAMFSSRWATALVPGIGSMTGDRASSQASTT